MPLLRGPHGLPRIDSGSSQFSSPLSVRSMLWWWDPYSPQTMNLRTVANLSVASNQYFTRADDGATDVFNFASGASTQFNLSFWIRFLTIPTGSCIIAKNELNASLNNGVWTLRFRGTNGAQVQLYCLDNATVTGLVTQDVTPANSGNSNAPLLLNKWYHVVLVYDGTQSTDAGVLKMWVDGVAATTTSSGKTLPSKFVSPATGNTVFEIGNMFGTPTGDLRMCNLLIDDSRVWSGTDVATLYNGSFPLAWTTAAQVDAAGF